MTFINVAGVNGTEWNKDSAVRAVETARVTHLVGRLLDDLAHLDAPHQPRLDYLDPKALDAVRSDPETFHVVGCLASGGIEGTADHCVATAYWSEEDSQPVDVELEISDDGVAWGPNLMPIRAVRLSHRLCATVDAGHERIEKLELG